MVAPGAPARLTPDGDPVGKLGYSDAYEVDVLDVDSLPDAIRFTTPKGPIAVALWLARDHLLVRPRGLVPIFSAPSHETPAYAVVSPVAEVWFDGPAWVAGDAWIAAYSRLDAQGRRFLEEVRERVRFRREHGIVERKLYGGAFDFLDEVFPSRR